MSARLTRFLATRRTVLALLPTIGGLDAEGFVDDLERLLRGVDGIEGLKVRKTADPVARFEVTGHFAGDQRVLADRLASVFVGELASAPGREAHRARVLPNRVTFEFVTWEEGRHHATARCVLTRRARGIARMAGGETTNP